MEKIPCMDQKQRMKSAVLIVTVTAGVNRRVREEVDQFQLRNDALRPVSKYEGKLAYRSYLKLVTSSLDLGEGSKNPGGGMPKPMAQLRLRAGQ